MPHILTRRQFVQTTTAAGVAAAAPATLFGQAPAVRTGVKPVVIASDNGNVYKNGGAKTGVQLAFDMITERRQGRARRARRRRQPVRARSRPTPASASAGCRTPKAWCSSIRAACTGRRSGPAAWRALEGVRTPSLVAKAVLENDRPSPAGRQGRAGVRAQHGLQDRGRPQHRESRASCGWNGSAASTPSTTSIRRSASDAVMMAGLAMVRDGLIDPNHFWGTINCDGVNSQGRGLRRHHHQRAGVEDSGPRRRLADSGRRPLRGRRRGRGRIHRPRRSQPLQPVLVPHRRTDADGQVAEGCRDGGAAARAEATPSRSAC